MFIARYDRTMMRANPVPDTGIDLSKSKGIRGIHPKQIRVRHVEPVSKPKPPRLSVPRQPLEFMNIAAERHGITVHDILCKSRKRRFVLARREAIALVWLNCRRGIEQRRWSLPEMGRVFGNLDHTTIMHHLKKAGLK